MTPASASRWRTANASTGVGNGPGNNCASHPAAAATSAASRANVAEPCRASNPMTTRGWSPTTVRR